MTPGRELIVVEQEGAEHLNLLAEDYLQGVISMVNELVSGTILDSIVSIRAMINVSPSKLGYHRKFTLPRRAL